MEARRDWVNPPAIGVGGPPTGAGWPAYPPKEEERMPRKGSGRRDTVKAKRATTYAQRNNSGRFTDLVEKGKSLTRDRKRKAKTKVKSGYGHRGDRVA
jgi:hypothetical protein